MNEYGIGTLAYIDSFGGLIPCKVIEINEIPRKITVKVTANRPGYKRNEIVTYHASWIIPRSSVYISCGKYKIRNNYVWRVK